MGFFSKKKEKKEEIKDKTNNELENAQEAFDEACSNEGERIAGALGSITQWHRSEQDFTQKNLLLQVALMGQSIIKVEYEITKEQYNTAFKTGVKLAKVYSENESSNLTGLIKRVEVADELSSEGKGDLITLLCLVVHLTLNFDTSEIYHKCKSLYHATCIDHLEGGNVFDQSLSLAEEILDEYGDQLNESFPLDQM